MPEQRAFATTTSTHYHERFATVDVEGNIVEHSAIPEFVDEIRYFDDGRLRHGEDNDE